MTESTNAITLAAEARYGYAGKQFIARITGRDAKFTFAREFIGRRSGKRNEVTTALVDEPGLYQERDLDSKGNATDTFKVIWHDGVRLDVRRVSEVDAMAIAKVLTPEAIDERGRQLAIEHEVDKLVSAADLDPDETLTLKVPLPGLEPGSHPRHVVRAARRREIARLGGEQPPMSRADGPVSTLVSANDREALLVERAKLEARIAEIDELLR